MLCERYSHTTEDGVYHEYCDLTLGWNEVRVLIRALEYYTDKRKLDFKERMLAGDMARAISSSKIIEQ